MENKVIEVIDALCDKFGIAIDWTSQNVFPYIQDLMGRIVSYEIVTSIFWVIFLCFVSCISFVFAKKLCKKIDEDDDYIAPTVILGIIFLVFLIFTLIAIPMQFHDIVEAITIPEKTFIDMISTYGS